MFNRVLYSLSLAALVFLVQAPSNAYGQRETRDRPDTVGSRSIGGKDRAESKRDKKVEDPEAKVDEQLRSAPRIANVGKMRSEALTTPGSATENAYEDAIARAQLEYGTRFKEELKNETFKNTHSAIKIEDFARAYIIALDPTVGAKIRTGYDLAVLRSMVTTYDDYKDILKERVPELSEANAKALISNAKKVVKAALSK